MFKDAKRNARTKGERSYSRSKRKSLKIRMTKEGRRIDERSSDK